jgi:hypothetical protein
VASSFDPNNIDGTYEFYSIATDVAGNIEAAPLIADSSTIFDHTNPIVSANNATNVWYTTNPNITLSVSDSIAKYNWDSAASASIGTNFTNLQTINIPSEGEHILYLYAEDNAGNSSTWSGLYKLDTIKPTGIWLSPTSGSTISGIANLSFDTSDAVVYKYAPDGSSIFTTITGPSWDTTSLALGKYILRATITDNAGNTIDVDENVYVAAVLTSFKHRVISTTEILIDWTTDRLTDGRVVFDRVSHFLVSEYPNSTGTVNSAPNYSTSHSVVIGGLAPGTYYHYRAVSAGTPVVVSFEESDRTSSEAVPGGVSDGVSTGNGGNPTVNTLPVVPPAPVFVQGEIAGIETEIIEPTLIPTPTPTTEQVLSVQDTVNSSNKFILLAILFSALSFVFLIFIIRMHV